MKKIITLLALAFCLNAKAQTYVAIPDSNFVHYLKTIVPTAFKGDSLNTSSMLVTTTTHAMNCSSKNIGDFTGLTYFKSLRYLNCSHNSLINPYIIVLPDSLTYLDCSYNYIYSASLPIGLRYLNCTFCSPITFTTLPDSLRYYKCTSGPQTPPNSFPNLLDTIIADVTGWSTLPALPPSLVYLNVASDFIECFPTFPATLKYADLTDNFFYCIPNSPPHVTFVVDYQQHQDTALVLCGPGNPNGCPDVVSGITQIKTENLTANIYPNPTQNNFVIETTGTDKQTLQLFNVNGKLVLTQNISGKTNIDASHLAEGVYNLSLQNASGVVNKRLVIVR